MHHVAVYTEQWLGYISSLFGGFFTLFLFSRSVFWFLLYEESLLFRIIKDSGMRLSLWLIYHHQNNIMNVPHFTTKYCAFFYFLVENRVTVKYWNDDLAGICWWQVKTEENKINNNRTWLYLPQQKKIEKLLILIWLNFKSFVSFLDVFLLHTRNNQLPLPPTVHHLSRLLGDIYNEVIFTGHPLLLFTNNPWAKMDVCQ